jgi:hypothetical protein
VTQGLTSITQERLHDAAASSARKTPVAAVDRVDTTAECAGSRRGTRERYYRAQLPMSDSFRCGFLVSVKLIRRRRNIKQRRSGLRGVVVSNMNVLQRLTNAR